METQEILDKIRIGLCSRVDCSPWSRQVWIDENKIELSFCYLEEIPSEIFCLPNLRSLSLRNNLIKKVPDEIGKLTGLTYLDLSGNLLSELPEGIDKLKNLRELDISGNQISMLPGVITKLGHLRFLNISYNSISVIPKEIANLPIDKLELYGNPLLYPPRSYLYNDEGTPIDNLKLFFNKYPTAQTKPFEIWRSDLYSFLMGIPTKLAIIETVLITFILCLAIIYSQWPLWTSLLFSPIVLLRNERSNNESSEMLRKLKLDFGHLAYTSPLVYRKPLWIIFYRSLEGMRKALHLVAGVILIKVYVGVKNLFYIDNWMSIPSNFRKLLTAVDLFTPAELIPGMEQEKIKDILDSKRSCQ